MTAEEDLVSAARWFVGALEAGDVGALTAALTDSTREHGWSVADFLEVEWRPGLAELTGQTRAIVDVTIEPQLTPPFIVVVTLEGEAGRGAARLWLGGDLRLGWARVQPIEAGPVDEISTITIGAPPQIGGRPGREVLADFYCRLLGMRVVRKDWLKIARGPFQRPHVALDGDGWSDLRPPRWPDPDYPQQVHLDVFVTDVEAAGANAVAVGARVLQRNDAFVIHADPAGHPFCLYPFPDGVDAAAGAASGVIGRVVFDCLSPRSLARFYREVVGMPVTIEDRPDRVVIAYPDGRLPWLGFQYADYVPPRWPDPAYPAQLHLDIGFADADAARRRADHHGGILLPKLSDAAVYADPAGHPMCFPDD